MDKAAYKIAKISVDRGWIPEDQFEWCRYVINKQMEMLIFIAITFTLSAVLHILPQTVIFTLCVYVLRRRIGGWHANNAFQCQVMSACLTIGTVAFLGPIMESVHPNAIFAIGEFLSGLLLFVQPAYPAQLHFSADVIHQNNARKNVFVGVLMLLQAITRFTVPQIGVYIFLSVAAVLVGVAAESIVQGGETNEKD